MPGNENCILLPLWNVSFLCRTFLTLMVVPLLRVAALFKNTNVEEVLNRQKQKRVQAREDAHKKKEMDKMQREKDKLSKQERKEKEKKRTQKGERKR